MQINNLPCLYLSTSVFMIVMLKGGLKGQKKYNSTIFKKYDVYIVKIKKRNFSCVIFEVENIFQKIITMCDMKYVTTEKGVYF